MFHSNLTSYLYTAWERFLFSRYAVLLILLSSITVTRVHAQTKTASDYEIRRISIQDGMASQVITALCTDKAGILWIGTAYGLYQFDGYRVTGMEASSSADFPVADQFITGLVSDTAHGNIILVGTKNGIKILDLEKHHTMSGSMLGLPSFLLDSCFQIQKSIGGFYWLLDKKHIYKIFHTDNGRFTYQLCSEIPEGLSPKIVADPTDPDGLWILPIQKDAYYLNAKGLQHFDIPYTNPPSPIPGLTGLIPTAKGLLAWDHARNIYKVNTDRKGIELANHQYSLYDIFPYMKGVDGFLHQKPIVNCVLSIPDGQNIFGTSLGLFILRKKLNCFQVIESIRGEEIRGIYADSIGSWWAGTYNGLYSGNLNKPGVEHFDILNVWDFLPLNDHTFLLANETRKGIVVWDYKKHRIIEANEFPGLPLNASKIKTALSVCRDAEGSLWFGTDERLVIATKSSPKLFQDFVDIGSGKIAPFKTVRALLPDPNSGVWVGSENGLSRIVYNPIKMGYETDPRVPNLLGIFISDLYLDRNQRLWIATKGKGLACLDLKNTGFPLQWFNTSNGLCNDLTSRIESSNKDQVLWISTHNGLSRLDVKSGIFHNFFEDSGFPGNEFNSAASASFPDGTLLFGGVSGLIAFQPGDIPADTFQHKTILATAKIYEPDLGALNTLYLSASGGIRLPPYPEYVEFQLGSTEFVSPSKVRFRYRLHGLSELWTYTSGEHEIKFIRLPPGHYTLEAQAIPLDGHFGKPVNLPILVETPFYETAWFRVFLVALVLAFAYGAYRFRLQQILNEQKIRQQIADDLHDDIGNKLNIISILAQKIVQIPLGNENFLQKLGDMSKLTEVSRNALRSLHTMIWSVDAKKDRLSILFNRMQDFADDYLRPLNIPFRFEVQKSVPNKDMELSARYHLILIYQELLTNMVKYTKPSLITISLTLDPDHILHLTLTNDHDPMSDKSYEVASAHRGLESIERRLKRIHGTISWSEVSAQKQVVKLEVPNIFKRY